VQNFCLPVCYRKTKIKIYSTTILPVVLNRYEIWFLTLTEELKLRFSEHRALKKISGPKGGEVTREWRRRHNEELHALYSSPNVIQLIRSRGLTGAGRLALWETGEMHTEFWWGELREEDYLEDPDVDGRIISEWIFKKWGGGAWTGLLWLRMGTGVGLL
jgi:hypothetical protein